MDQNNLNQAKSYIEENRGQFSSEQLSEQLNKAGYGSDVVVEALRQAGVSVSVEKTTSGEALSGTATSFWNFKEKHVYTSGWQKFGDFLFGFLFFPFVYLFISLLSFFLGIFLGVFSVFLPIIFSIWAIVYFWRRRKFISIGLIFSFITIPLIPIILMAVAFSMISY